MNAKASAMVTPSSLRYRCAAPNSARGEMSCLARTPLVLAGERRKIFEGIGAGSSAQLPECLLQQLLPLFLIPFLAAVDQLVGAAQVGDDRKDGKRLGRREETALERGDLVVDRVGID